MCVSNKDIQSEIIRQRIREGMVKELKNQMSRKQIAKVRIAYNKVSVARYNRVMKSDDEVKQRKVTVEYVKLCGYKNGEMGNGRKKECQLGAPTLLSLDEIASQLGTSKTNLKRALTIERNLTESMKQLLNDGVISKTVQQRK